MLAGECGAAQQTTRPARASGAIFTGSSSGCHAQRAALRSDPLVATESNCY
jgi:hypothetical protein